MVAERMYRTQILLEPAQHRALAELARRERRSVSDLVREMVQQGLQHRQESDQARRQRQIEVLERIRQHGEEMLARRGGKLIEPDPATLINQIRDERDEYRQWIADHFWEQLEVEPPVPGG